MTLYTSLLTLCKGPLDSPTAFKGHAVRGSKGAVAVEAEECSYVGVDSKKYSLKKFDRWLICMQY